MGYSCPRSSCPQASLHLLNDTQRVFGDSPDPEFEGHYLMEVVEAQVGLAFRGSLKQTEHPPLAITAARLGGGMVTWLISHYDKSRAIKAGAKVFRTSSPSPLSLALHSLPSRIILFSSSLPLLHLLLLLLSTSSPPTQLSS